MIKHHALALDADHSTEIASTIPTLNRDLHIGQPSGEGVDSFIERVRTIFDRRWFTNNGEFVQELESRIARYLGVRHCLATCNGTVALELALRALKLSGEVIVPSFTFAATAHAVRLVGLEPVFCEVDQRTHCLDPAHVEQLITDRTSAVLGVHVWGRPCAVDELSALCAERGLRLLFDAAHAFGCSHRGKMLGGFGDAEVFSFHATKFFHTGEGGAITTNCDQLAAQIRLLRNFGFAGIDSVESIGGNGKMSELSAALGLGSFDELPDSLKRNAEARRRYQAGLADLPGVSVVEFEESESNNFQYLIVEVDQTESGFSRDELLSFLRERRVLARRYFYPGCHRMTPYVESTQPRRILPKTDALCSRVLCLPTGTSVSSEEISIVIELVREFSTNVRG